MKHTFLNTKLLAVSLIASLSMATPILAQDGFTQITTAAEFNKRVVGKRLYLGKDYVMAQKNGKLTGKFGGKTLKGAWAWRDGLLCRTLTTHSKDTDCQRWAISGDGKQHHVTRTRGTGKSFVYVSN